MGKVAVFLNNAREAGLLERRTRDWDFVIPVGADARYHAERAKWPQKLIRDFFTAESHAEERERAEQVIRSVIAGINAFFGQSRNALLAETGSYFSFDLYVILGQVLFTRALLERVARSCESYIFENRHALDERVLGIRPHPDVLLSSVAKVTVPGQSRIVPYEVELSRASSSALRRLRSVVPPGAVDLAYSSKWMRLMAREPACWLRSRTRILVLGGMFDWKPIVFSPQFGALFRPTFRAFDGYPHERGNPHRDAELSALISQAVFGHGGAPDYFRRLAHSINSTATYLERNEARLDRLVKRHQAVIGSIFVTPMQNAVAALACRQRLPVVCYQHGEMNLYPDAFGQALGEMGFTTHYLAYAPGVVGRYLPYVGKTPLKEVIVAGTTRKNPKYEGGNLVIYATGKWFKTARPFNHDADPDARLYEAQQVIIERLESLAAQFPDIQVVLKANNTYGFNAVPFPTSLEIDYTSRFTDLLRSARLVILDAPGTTCIEAASTPVPLFVLSGRAPWYPEPTRLLQRRAVSEQDPGRLMQHVEAFLREGRYPADLRDRGFADGYGGSMDAQAAARNALGHLRRIACEGIAS